MEVTIRGDFFKDRIVAQYGSVINFAEVAGVSRAYIYALINGERTPGLEFAARLAVLLDVTIDDLVESTPKDEALAVM